MARLAARPAKSTISKKRTLSDTTPSRQSKRVKSLENTPNGSQSTPKTSKYFEPDSEDGLELLSESEFEGAKDESGYEDEDEDAAPDSSSEELVEDDSSDGGQKIKKKKNGVRAGVGVTRRPADTPKELWRPGTKTGLGPGQQVVIKKPKAREAGKTPYADSRVHPNTLLFLKDLAQNNDREWLKMHDPDYRTSVKDFQSFVSCLTEKIMEKDETIPELPAKDLVFRIYRDVRFSPDQTPYKSHFSAAWSRTGRKGPYAAYYLQIQPGGSFIGGGLWHPEADPLARLRRDVDRHSHRLKSVLVEPRVRREFLKGVPNDERKAVKTFVKLNAENALKTKPKGFDADNKNIDLLRLRNYTIGRELDDEEVLGANGLSRIADLVGVLTPFITHLNSVVMPDDVHSSDDGSSEGETGDEAASGGEGETGDEAE